MMKSKEKKNPIEEARRYVANAEETIERAVYDSETKSYTDRKYVKTAGDILWKGCLIALDAVFGINKRKGRPDIDKYKKAAGERDKKLLTYIVDGYNTMHLSMGYDGIKRKKYATQALSLPTTSLTAAPCFTIRRRWSRSETLNANNTID